MKQILLISFFFKIVICAYAQTCSDRYLQTDAGIQKAVTYFDQFIKTKTAPAYIESFISYPVLTRKYINKKFKDSVVVNRIEDLQKVVWCFDGLCLNNNKNFYLSKNEVTSKLKQHDIADNYFRESVCALCTQYKPDSNQIKSILDYNDTTYFNPYSMLHKVLQLKNLDYNKCISKELFARYKTQLTDTISKLYIQTENVLSSMYSTNLSITNLDVFTEAVLMISLLDDQQNISDNLYDIVLNTQTANGTWQVSANNVKLNEHATLVSLWLLLDYREKLNEFK